MNHSQKPFLGNCQLRSLIFFLIPLKHQDKLVNKADRIHSHLLCTRVRNTSVEASVRYINLLVCCELYVVETPFKCWAGLEFEACEVDSRLCKGYEKDAVPFPINS